MSQINIAEAEAHFSELVQKALLGEAERAPRLKRQGEEVIIAKDNKPVLRLIPFEPSIQARHPGTAKGQILYIAPDFDKTPGDFCTCCS